MASVFISYSHLDRDRAREIDGALRGAGLACWRDERWLEMGADYAEEITRAIHGSDAFVILLSRASNSSDFVAREAAIAHYFHKTVFPVLIEPGPIADALLPYVVRLHMWDLREQGPEELARSMARLISEEATSAGDQAVAVPATAARPAAAEPEASPAGTTSAAAVQAPFVTNREYGEFAQSARRGQAPPPDSLPVTGVSWDDATAYCDWTGGRLPAPGDDLSLGAQLPGGAAVYEWWDAGTESQKQMRDLTGEVVGLLDKSSQRPDVGFRVIKVGVPQKRRMLLIEAGTWLLGSDPVALWEIAGTYRIHQSLASPILARMAGRHRLESFQIAGTCVTNAEYFAFTQATGRRWPGHWDAKHLPRSSGPYASRLASSPVVNVSAEDAQAYCMWSRTRLPSWMEWERAASGPDRNPYPWGARFEAQVCNSVESGRGAVAGVSEYPSGASPEGVLQLCGNVAEWVTCEDGLTEVRGGSYRLPCEFWGLAYAFRRVESWLGGPDIGFRVVAK